MFPKKLMRRAVELSEDGSASWVLEELRKEFKDEAMPDVRTVNRWISKARKQQIESADLADAVKKTPRKRLITNDGLYEKIMDIPPWTKTIE